VGVLSDRGLNQGADVKVLGGNVGLGQRLVVDINLAVNDANMVARHSDYPLDVALGGIERVVEDNDVATLNGLKLIDELVYENALLVLQTGEHAGALHLYWLIEKDDYEGRDSDRYEEITNPAPHVTVPARLDGCGRSGLRDLSAGLGGLLHR